MLSSQRQKRRQEAMLTSYRRRLWRVERLQRAWTLTESLLAKRHDDYLLIRRWLRSTERVVGAKLMRRYGLTRIDTTDDNCNMATIVSVVRAMLDQVHNELRVLDYLWTIAPPGGDRFRTFDVSSVARYARKHSPTNDSIDSVIDRFHLHQLLLLQIEYRDNNANLA